MSKSRAGTISKGKKSERPAQAKALEEAVNKPQVAKNTRKLLEEQERAFKAWNSIRVPQASPEEVAEMDRMFRGSPISMTIRGSRRPVSGGKMPPEEPQAQEPQGSSAKKPE